MCHHNKSKNKNNKLLSGALEKNLSTQLNLQAARDRAFFAIEQNIL